MPYMGAGSGWEKGWGAGIFTLPCQGEGRGPKGRGVGQSVELLHGQPLPLIVVSPRFKYGLKRGDRQPNRA